jgi:hypothetical protein
MTMCRQTFGRRLCTQTSSAFARTICVALAGVVLVSNAALAEDVLKVIPDNALAVAVVNRPAALSEKIDRAAKLMGAPAAPDVFGKVKAALKEGFDDRGMLAAAIVPADKSEPSPVATLVFVPVTDYPKFIAQFEPDDATATIVKIRIPKSVFAAKVGSFAVLAEPANEATLKTALASTKSVAGQLNPLGASWLAESDAYAALTPEGIKFAAHMLAEEIGKAKAALAGFGDPKQAEVIATMFGWYETMFRAAEKEITHVGIAASLADDSRFQLSGKALFASGGQLAKLADGIEPAGDGALAGLPAGPYAMAGAGAMSPAAFGAMMNSSMAMMKGMPAEFRLTDEQSKKLIELTGDALKGVRGISMSIGPSKPGQGIYGGMAVSMRVDDSNAFLASYEKALAAMNKLAEQSASPLITKSQTKRFVTDGVDALEVTMQLPALASLPGVGAPGAPDAKALEALLGPSGKVTVFMAAADAKTIVGAYVSKERLQQALKAARDRKASLAADAGIVQTAKHLPAGAQWVGFVSPKGTLEFVSGVVKSMIPPGVDTLPRVLMSPEFPDTPPIGMAATVSRQGAEGNLVVPAAVLKAAGEYTKHAASGGSRVPPP